MIKIVVPGTVPSVNHHTFLGGHGRQVLSKAHRAFRDRVADVVGVSVLPWKYCRLVIEYRPPDKRRRDVDNYNKAILDALTACGFWDDDECVRDIRVFFLEPKKKADACVTIKVYEEEAKYKQE